MRNSIATGKGFQKCMKMVTDLIKLFEVQTDAVDYAEYNNVCTIEN